VAPTRTQVEATLEWLGLTEAAGEWSVTVGGYTIKVHQDAGKPDRLRVDYGSKLKVSQQGAASLSKPENLVVLECVLRLLRLGYRADHIELEPTWKLGHKAKGRLDILLKTPADDAYAMIECKTWGAEYSKERNNLLADGGQLFSYYVQDRAAEGLYLYASKVDAGEVSTQIEFFKTEPLEGNNKDELFDSWDRQLYADGLFKTGFPVYNADYRALRRKELRQLDRESGKGLFNSFAEVLRRHVLSDKANAFNKIFNLFVCKLQDEDSGTAASDEMKFQWKPDDTPDTFIERLTMLYRQGIRNYLGIKVDPRVHSELLEFAFIDVYDQVTLARNTAIVREVVQLLQNYQIRYSEKHQFLGDFFEMLLNTGLKQEAGQFFTPVPLARFVVESLPLESVMAAKVAEGRNSVLPDVIDFACGAAHFLTEAIDAIDGLIDRTAGLAMHKEAHEELLGERRGYRWAKEHIYGIEGDYRLAKVAKIAMFLNGDGDARIISGNGLDDFYESRTYQGRLKAGAATNAIEEFDALVSNPPYSIANFRRDIEGRGDRFTLFPFVTHQGGEIEVLFLERAGQLLKEGGVAGIFLPLSVLNNDQTIYRAMRRLLFATFEVIAIVELREKTFLATNTTTVCMFLRKRRRADFVKAFGAVHAAFQGVSASEAQIDAAATSMGLPAELVAEFAGHELWDRDPNVDVTPPAVYQDEMLVWAVAGQLDRDRELLVAFSGESGQAQEAFLGYRFSKARGSEGIQVLEESALWNEVDKADESKLAVQIRGAFNGENKQIPDALSRNAVTVTLSDLVDPATLRIENPSSLFVQHAAVTSNSPFGDFIDGYGGTSVSLTDLVVSGEMSYVDGVSYTKADEAASPTPLKVLTATNLDLNTGLLVTKKLRYLKEGTPVSESARPRAGDLLMSIASGSLTHLGKVVYVPDNIDAYAGGFLRILRFKDVATAKFVQYNLLSLRFRKFVAALKDQNISNLTKSEIERFNLHRPSDLAAFQKDAEAREKVLAGLAASMSALNS
jgi:type I restriction enzyme M protein